MIKTWTLIMAISLPLWGQSPPPEPTWDFQPPHYEIIVKAAGIPDIDPQEAHTERAGYLSLPGRLRYLTYAKLGEWLTVDEATRVVAERQQWEAADR